MSDAAPEWLRIARRESMRGIREVPGRGNEERILLYHQATTLRALADSVPWCSSFACWCIEEAGIRSTRCAAARSWLEWGRVIQEPALGCIAVLKRGGPDEPGADVVRVPDSTVLFVPGHVGFFEGWSCSDEVLVRGGNQADRVCVRAYPLERVLGYRWPTEASTLRIPVSTS